MKHALWFVLLCSAAEAATCGTQSGKKPAELVETEQRWARSLEQGDTATLGCILADEFEDAGPDGQLASRAATLTRTEKQAGVHSKVHHELSELDPHIHAEFGYIRGLAVALDREGKIMARVRFTDVYIYRDGRWQCVAAHESMLKESGQ